MGRTERDKCLWAANIRTCVTVAPAVRNLAHPAHMAIPTISLPERAKALWIRRSRAGSSSAATMTRPATSAGVREHSIQVSQRSRLMGKKSAHQGWVASQQRGRMVAHKRARHPLKRSSGGGFVPHPLGRRSEQLRANSCWCVSTKHTHDDHLLQDDACAAKGASQATRCAKVHRKALWRQDHTQT